MKIKLLPALISLLFCLNLSAQSITIEEVNLIKIFIPDELSVEFGKLEEIANAIQNSETSKALDGQFALLMSKIDGKTASVIKYLLEEKNEKEDLQSLISGKARYYLKHPFISSDVDEHYKCLRQNELYQSSPDFFEPKNCILKYKESIELIELDQKLLIERAKAWTTYSSTYKRLLALEKEIPNQEAEVAKLTRLKKARKKQYNVDVFNPKAKEKLDLAVEEWNNAVALKKKLKNEQFSLRSSFSETEKLNYKETREQYYHEYFNKIPDFVAKIRL